MKLTESFKILASTSPGSFARALRAIGQDLASLFPETLEIELRGETFFARGQCAKERLDAKLPKQEQRKGLKAFCADMLARDVSDLAREAKSANVDFSLAYNPADINRIDEMGASRRFSIGKTPDIRSLGEMLRTIGRLVDGREGQLVKVYKDARRIVFEYAGSRRQILQ